MPGPVGNLALALCIGMDVAEPTRVTGKRHEEKDMTRRFSHTADRKSAGTNAIAAIAGVVLVALCATGIAAFAGLLPESEQVASVVTATPIIDVQVGDRRNESNSRVEPGVETQVEEACRTSRKRLQHAVIVA
jgi:hypothetical protein